ncbi:ABC transporter substrate-binding protein [Angustibacter sp. McL0619]|uniref:ABC transporter substrate-binding protein n=1 Tax=Angustibacter sp. McL0619 TaxID=3415676 RepID=UPI003CEE6A5E
MRNKTPLVVVVGATSALVLTGCGGSSGTSSSSAGSSSETAVTGGTLNMLGTGDVDYMDPNISYYSIGYQGLRMWSRQLFTYPAVQGKTTTAVPDLATVVPTSGNGISADGKTYTLTLRPGVKWDTTPTRAVTAADVVRGVKRTCNPVQPFGGLPDYESLIQGMQSYCNGFAKVAHTPTAIAAYVNGHPLAGVVAQDASTVVFHLTRPASYFLDMLTLPAFSPAPVEFMKYLPASSALAQHTVSDGPYRVDSYVPTKSITFSRNPAWDPATDPVRKAYVDTIKITETSTQDSIQQQLQTGTPSADMEFDAGPPPSQLPGLVSKKDSNLNLGATSSSNPYVVFNTVSPNNSAALSKVPVRQALSYAINRAHIQQVLGGPTLNPALTHVLPPEIVGSKDFDLYPNDVSKAKSMLAAAGYPHGLTLKFLYRNAAEGSSKAFQTIQQDLGQVGVKVVGVPSPNADFYTKYLEVPSVAKRGVWDVSLAGWGADWYSNAALSFFSPLFAGSPSFPPVGSNFGLYSDPTTTELINQAAAAQTEAAAVTLWQQADQQVMKDAAFYPITDPLNPNYHASQVHGAVYVPAIQNFDPTNVWLSSGKQGG